MEKKADSEFDEEFIASAKEAGFAIGSKELSSFKEYYRFLVEKNKVMNLTAITEYKDVLIKHFLDSLLVGSVINELKSEAISCKALSESDIADIGTGAGFPGVPLKICSPKAKITLIDSLNKRISFLNELIIKLELNGISAVHGRCEDLGREKGYREGFDYVFSRAVARLSVLCEYCIPFLKKGGLFVAYKADEVEGEVEDAADAIKKLGGELLCVSKRSLPGADCIRSFCVVSKIKDTPTKYPRKAGIPAKSPL